MKKTKKNNKGFSLVELIVVIAIMAVLVGVVAPQFIGYVEASKEATDIQNLENAVNALDVKFAEGDSVPATLTITMMGAAQDVSGVAIPAIKGNWGTPLTATYSKASNAWTYAGVGDKYQAANSGTTFAKITN